MEFSRPGNWGGWPFPPPRCPPNPGIEPRFPALQADSLQTSNQMEKKERETNQFTVFKMNEIIKLKKKKKKTELILMMVEPFYEYTTSA